MAKEKVSKSRSKDQKSITSFFGGGKAKKKQEEEPEELQDEEMDAGGQTADASSQAEESAEEPEPESDDVDMDAPSTSKKDTKAAAAAVEASNLPPIHDIPTIFSDLVSRIPDIEGVVRHVQGRKLRVATMCSGTESPLLALELIQKSIEEQFHLSLDVEHVFSCEIEPFKQAYIERNFHPPLLFRDVCELGDDEAHTAYGSLAPVPGDVDLLIAGTSCVDFRGMMKWVQNHRPPIVILENVCGAPWDKVKDYFEDKGYSAAFQRVDTKQYYIPHTRTRVYLVAVNKENSEIPKKWHDWIKTKLKRPASSTLDDFLLPSDDPRIHQARQKLVQESYNALDRRTGRTDWSRCESRHQRARLEELLGQKRPLTSWDEGGFCKLPDYAWGDWGIGQVERVWDLMDISLLRAAVEGVDPSYKTHVWNLSQNVDRNIGSGKVGICPCLTPSMIPYITNRGGPMVGLEALSMQGLPIDKLLLTRETEDQLADLAGNAMTTTVVGACILAALVTGKKLLKAGDDTQTYETKAGADEVMNDDDVMAVDKPVTLSTVVGDDELAYQPLDLSVTGEKTFSQLLEDAHKSARLCQCEGRADMTSRPLLRCADCGHSSCNKCGGRPEHNAVPIDLKENPRLPPSDFAKELKSTLPMCIRLSEVTQELLDQLKNNAGISIPSDRWSKWSSAVKRVCTADLRFVETKRQEIWSAVYRSPSGFLELLLHPQQPEWRLYAFPEEKEPANAEIRRLLEFPVGRLSPKDGLLSGQWTFSLPHATQVHVKISGVGELVPSWEARLGLLADKFKEKQVYPTLKISVPTDDIGKFERDITGEYDLLDRCGTASNALHKKRSTPEEVALPPLFLLMNPHRIDKSQDCFVLSTSNRRYEYGETRPIICNLNPSWRQSSKSAEENVTCTIPTLWVPTDEVRLEQAVTEEGRFGIPPSDSFAANASSCSDAHALLVCTAPLRGQAGAEWPVDAWKDVDKVHERGVFKSLAWLLERVRTVDEKLATWHNVSDCDTSRCQRCAPTAPAVTWTTKNKKMVAVEDPVEAGEYERRLKSRPSPFLTQLRLSDDGKGTVRIGVNIPSLLHRALSRLPSKNRTAAPVLSWRINTNFTPLLTIDLPPFVIESNKQDKEHDQPPSFKIPLRKEQLRSLEWMIAQESPNAKPFVEEEISEAILDPLGWRAEGCAQRPVRIRGGVLADQVGYGKTAITLGLIDCMSKSADKEFGKMGRIPGKIAVKATLVVVPPHLTRQWDSEVKKFTKKRFNVHVISTASNLNSTTIEKIQEADIVIVASNLFKSNVYLENLQLLAGVGELPSKEGRQFNDHLEKALDSLKHQVDLLQDEGSSAVMAQIKKAEENVKLAAAAAAAQVQSKRLKGRQYRAANEQADTTKEIKPKKEKPSARTSPKPTTGSTKDDMIKASPTGRVMEVFIDTAPPKKVPGARNSPAPSSRASSPPETELESDEDAPRKLPKRTAKRTLIISDDEESEPAPKKKQKKKAAKGKTTDESSDYEESGAEDSESEDDVAVSSDDEESKPKPSKKTSSIKPKKMPTKPQPKSKSKSKATSSNDDSDVDAMDVDEAPAKGKKSTKRKAADDNDRPAKKQKRADSDPWKLQSKPVRNDWTQMQAPPLEMFHYSRVVVDEYTYLDGKVHSLVTRQSAERNWVLSGTPPIHDFGALKTIAAFLNIHLGVDDDGEGQSPEVKKRRREQTAVERFHSFREVHSLEWHAHRHQLGQNFLNQFVRQNIAEIDEIPWTEKLEKVVLPAAERAIYLELEHHLRAMDMTIKRSKKNESDREKRLAQSLGDSKSAEEALLKRCSHFEIETSNDNAMKACDIIVKERQRQLDECKADLLKALKEGVKREKKLPDTGSESMFLEFIRVSRSDEGVDDKDASDIIVELLDEAGAHAPKVKPKPQEMKLSEKVKEAAWEHREKTHEIRRLAKELVGRVRSLRYFTVVRDLQKQREKPPVVDCLGCSKTNLPLEEVAVLSSCGHMGCLDCVKRCAEKEECVYAASGQCKSAARVLNIVKADTLGTDDNERSAGEKHFGMKLEKVTDLIKNRIGKEERVLVFVQFPDLMKKVADAFDHNKIKYLEIKGSATQRSKNLEQFQNNSKERVLLLNVMDESASGANLTSANHAIFLSPLLAPSKEIYKACETQAIGRLVRFGQTNHVYVYRFLTTNTIDEEIYEQRKEVQVHGI